MARARKYLKGEPIVRISDAIGAILSGDYIMVRDKPTHPGWAGSWSLHTLRQFVSNRWLHYAIINPAWVAPKETEE